MNPSGPTFPSLTEDAAAPLCGWASRKRAIQLALGIMLGLLGQPVSAAVFHVSPQGNDAADGGTSTPLATIRAALQKAQPGDDVALAPGVYSESVAFPRSGTQDQPIRLRAAGGGAAVLSGAGREPEHMVMLEDRSFITVEGLELTGIHNAKDASAIRIEGSGRGLRILNCRIHDIKGRDAMGITVYGTRAEPIQDLLIRGNEIYDCEPAKSEALVLNGNIDGFEVSENRIHDVNNIGIDLIGGEAWVNPNRQLTTRNGLCRGNLVYRCRANYGGGYAAGIYVDGGQNIRVEDNIVTQCDLGIEVGAENRGTVTRSVVVKGNTLFYNDKAGLVFGGYDEDAGRVEDCVFEGNICTQNDRHRRDVNAELWIQWASGNRITGNVFIGGSEEALVMVEEGAGKNTLSGNRYYSAAGYGEAYFLWKDEDVEGFDTWQRKSGQDGDSQFGPVKIDLPQVDGTR